MRGILAVVVVSFAFVLCGCTSNGASAREEVHGLLAWSSGSQPIAGPGTVGARPTAGTVSILDGNRVLERINVGPDGRFAVLLEQGTYVVEGAPNSGGARCLLTKPPLIVATSPLSIRLECRYTGLAPG
jgi:hypothetical protein